MIDTLSTPLEDLSDEELFETARSSGENSEEFRALYHRYRKELSSYLRRYLGDATLADDVMQHTWLQVWLKRDTFEAGRKFRPWLYTIATNQAIDAQRRGKKHRIASLDRENANADATGIDLVVDDKSPKPSEPLESEERINKLREAMQQLPEDLRYVIQRTDIDGEIYRVVAEELHIPLGTVKSRRYSAVLRLREILERAA